MRFPSAVCAPFSDAQAVLDFGRGCDVLTYELEAVHAGALAQLEGEGIEVWHRPEILALLQNKISQKEFYVREGLPTAPFHSFERLDELKAFWRMGSLEDLVNLPDTPALLEQKIDIALELAVITVRDQKGNIRCYDPCLMHFDPRANLVSRVMAGSAVETEALLPNHLRSQAMEMAAAVADGLGTVGVLAVEFLLDTQGRLLVNESAPRPHNSGHYTIEAAHCSQFEQHIRAVMGWPLGDTSLRSAAVMVNLVGAEGFRGPVVYPGLDQVLSLPGVFVHLYGKAETRPFRKMGHVTVVHPDLAVANQIADRVEACLRIEAGN
jgi:5-(carboxyamino)imidazole ribonucleotide synthase